MGYLPAGASKHAVHLPGVGMSPISGALTFGQIPLTKRQRKSLGGKTYVPRIRGPGEAMPRDTDKMNSVYKPPEWTTRTGR